MSEAGGDLLKGLRKVGNSRGFGVYCLPGRVGGNGVDKLGGTADALSREQGEHRPGIVILELALLPLLNRPGSLTHVIYSVAEVCQDARVYSARANLLFEAEKLGPGFAELKIDAPKSFTGNQKLDGNAQRVTFLGTARSDNARPIRFAGKEIR